MSLIEDISNYKYIGLPFEAFGWPGPIKQRLVASNDGLNWDTLKRYDWGWRDIDIMQIGNRYYICATDDCVHYTDDFETFTQIPVKSGYKMSWAPEWFKDKDGTIYMFYAAGNSTSNFFRMFYRSFNPNNLAWGNPIPVSFEDENSSRIDPNIHYINGKYYMWIANQQSHDVELYRADKINGVYYKISTNMHSRTIEAGFNRNEAPEMIKDGNKYYLYTDPWKDGVTSEHDRMLYRCESTDLVNWSTMEKCVCSFGMRHFTPQAINKSITNNTTGGIQLWDGNPGTLNDLNIQNFSYIQNIIDHINALSESNPLFSKYETVFDLQQQEYLNRNSRQQFIKNAKILEQITPKIMSDILIFAGVINYDENMPEIPKMLYLDETIWNTYWKAISEKFNLIQSAINQLSGG